MEIVKLRELLEVLSTVGIEEVVLEPSEDGTLIRGSNKEATVVVFHEIEDNMTDGSTLAIQSVKGLLSRIALFDMNKASLIAEDDGELILTLTVKQSRKSATYRCASPGALHVPKKIPGDLGIVNPIVFSSEYVDQISQAISSISQTGAKDKRAISMSVDGGVASLSIFDGESDDFTDQFEVDFPDKRSVSWEAAAFQRVMKQSLSANKDKCIFSITEYGIAPFSLGVVSVLLVPIG